MANAKAGRRWLLVPLAAALGLALLALPSQTRASQEPAPAAGSVEQRLAALEATVKAQAEQISALESTLAAQAAQLAPFSTQWTTPGRPENGYEVYLTNANLHIVNGLGATNGYTANPWSTDPASTRTNGHGNLIIGYDEVSPTSTQRTGSHNLVVGAGHTYSSFGGLVAGRQNAISAPYASVSGGAENTASHECASVSGGRSNEAGGSWASVSGGELNAAGGAFSSVSGGKSNSADGGYSSVSGGQANTAGGGYASVGGGKGRSADDAFGTGSG